MVGVAFLLSQEAWFYVALRVWFRDLVQLSIFWARLAVAVGCRNVLAVFEKSTVRRKDLQALGALLEVWIKALDILLVAEAQKLILILRFEYSSHFQYVDADFLVCQNFPALFRQKCRFAVLNGPSAGLKAYSI